MAVRGSVHGRLVRAHAVSAVERLIVTGEAAGAVARKQR